MNIGMITCNYYLSIYGYREPDGFDWGAMVRKYRAEFTKADFLKLADQIRQLGYDGLEIWEPTFSHFVYAESDAAAMAEELKAMGFRSVAYCIGGWGVKDIPHVEKACRFARALGAKTVVGCINREGADALLQEIDRCAKLCGLRFGIENHPAPNFESPEEVLRATQGYQAVGANLDTGIYHAMGYDVLAAAELLKDKIFHVHLKDSKRGGMECFPLGRGDAPLAELCARLKEWGYSGMLSVEYEHTGDPAPGLAESLAFVRKSIG